MNDEACTSIMDPEARTGRVRGRLTISGEVLLVEREPGMSTNVEQREFQAETRELLDLMIHSIYSNKDTFLRELISHKNISAACLRMKPIRA